jgi:hypothetical protein
VNLIKTTKDKTNMNNETKNDFDQDPVIGIGEAELETIAAALRVRSGLQAGLGSTCPIIPCL